MAIIRYVNVECEMLHVSRKYMNEQGVLSGQSTRSDYNVSRASTLSHVHSLLYTEQTVADTLIPGSGPVNTENWSCDKEFMD